MSTPISLSPLKSFGDVAAEDDSVLDYFLQTHAVARIRERSVLLVLGRKGAGKTALVRYFVEGTSGTLSRSINLRGYPWAVHASRVDHGASEIEAYVSSWRYLISVQLATLVLSNSGNSNHPDAKSIRQFLNDNYGSSQPKLSDVLRPPRLRLSSLSFEPEVLGCKLGGISLERGTSDLAFGQELDALSDMLISAAVGLTNSLKLPEILLHFDELDQGLSSLSDRQAQMLTGLILAARGVRQTCSANGTPISPIIYLRTDLWDDLKFSDKNKLNETLCLNLGWQAGTLLDLVNVRLRTRLNESADWDSVTTDELMRGSQSKWNHIIARTFLRPRDVIKFLNAALDAAKRRADDPLLLANKDITSAREQYSSYLKLELDDEIRAHWAQWEEALQACSAISTITFDRERFMSEYERRRSKDNAVSGDGALELLFRFSVIGYERRSGYGGSSWAFQYIDPEAGWDNSATTFKVHLGLKEYAKLREERS